MQYFLEVHHSFPLSESGNEGLRASASELRFYKEYIQRLYQEKNNTNGHHDVGHIARVLVLASVLCGKAEVSGTLIDRDVVYVAIVLHDAERHGLDVFGQPDHAEMAADLFTPGVRILFPAKQAEHILSVVRHHNKFPDQLPDRVKTNEFFIFTGADALDLVRLHDGRTARIFTHEAWELRETAQELERRSGEKQSGDVFEDVLSTATEMGMISA